MRTLLLAAVCASAAALAQPSTEEITGRYSNVRVVEGTGAIVGVELLVLSGGAGMSVMVRSSDETSGAPMLLRLDVRGNDIEFAVPASCPCGLQEGRYHGTVSEAGITLNGPSSFGQRFLARSGYLRER